MRKREKTILLHAVIAVTAICAVAATVFAYVARLEGALEAETNRALLEISTQSAQLIGNRINTDRRAIEAASQSLGSSRAALDSPEILQALERQRRYTNFQVISVADLEGNVYEPDGGEPVNVGDRAFFRQALEGRTLITSAISSIDGAGMVMVAAAPVTRDGEIAAVVLGRYLLDDMRALLDVNLFEGRGFNYVADSAGRVFLYPDHPDADPDFKEMATDFAGCRFRDRNSLGRMLSDMRRNLGGTVAYEKDGQERILAYLPIGINDWYLISVVPREVITSRSHYFFRLTCWLMAAVLGVFVLVILYAFRLQQKSAQRLRLAHDELSTLYNTLPGGVFRCRCDERWTVVFANDGFYRFLGYTRDEFAERRHGCMAEVIYPDDLQRVTDTVAEQLAGGGAIAMNESRLVCADDSVKWIWFNAVLEQGEEEERYLYCTFVDNTPLRQAQKQLSINQQRYDIVMEQTQDILFEWDMRTGGIYHTKNFQKKFGYNPPSQGFPQSIVDAKLVEGEDVPTFLGTYQRLREGERFVVGEFRIRDAGGLPIWCRATITAVYDESGQPCRAVGLISDIDRQKRQLQQIEDSARRDAMTRLYNKTFAEELVRRHLAENPGPAALLLADIDNFKGVNDTLGHLCGDAVLCEVAHALRGCFRSTDVVGRAGGDEFLVFLPDMPKGPALARKAEELCEVFHRAGAAAGCEISGSVGIALCPADGRDYTTLFEHADVALYDAKRHGKNRYAFYSPEADTRPAPAGASAAAPVRERQDSVLGHFLRLYGRCGSVGETFPALMGLLGRAFGLSRVYLVAFSKDGSRCWNTFEWCREGVPSMRDRCQGAPTSLWDVQNPPFAGRRLFSCVDARVADFDAGALLERGVIFTLVGCVGGDGVCRMLAGFEDCERPREATDEEREAVLLLARLAALFLPGPEGDLEGKD